MHEPGEGQGPGQQGSLTLHEARCELHGTDRRKALLARRLHGDSVVQCRGAQDSVVLQTTWGGRHGGRRRQALLTTRLHENYDLRG